MTYQFRHLPQPGASQESAGPRTFGRRSYVPGPSRRRRKASRASRTFCALMVLWGAALLVAGAI